MIDTDDTADGSAKPAPVETRRLWGRGQGRGLSARRQGLIEEVLPRLAIPITAGQTLDLPALFPGRSRFGLEIGFGGGEHLAARAARDPEVGWLGAEPFREGVAKAVAAVTEQGLDNVRLHAGDGRDLLDALPDGAIERAYVLFPDPWPKTRHAKRRLLQPAVVASLARVLAPGGTLRVATDVVSNLEWTLEVVRRDPGFTWTARRPDDWRRPPADHITTRYETKRLGDCAPVFLDFRRG